MIKSVSGQFLGAITCRRTFKNFSIIESLYAPREELSRHSHERAFISIALRGLYTEHISTETHECEAGQAIFHTAGEAHANRFSPQGGHLLNLEFLPHFLSSLTDNGFQTRTRVHCRNSHLLQLAFRLQGEMAQKDAASELAVEGLALELVAGLIRESHSPSRKPDAGWLSRVRDMLHDRFRESVTLKELADAVNVHPVYLARAFRQRNHCSVGDYIRRLRVEAACRELANSSTPLVEVAIRTGFSDQSHFSRTLKQHTGMSPNQFRQQHSRRSCAG